MPFLEWKDDYSVNVRTIDDQHKQLFRMVNELHAAMKEGRGKTIIADLIGRLEEYTNYHFLTEEGLMVKCGYRDIESHRKEHFFFRNRIAMFRSDLEDGQFALTLDVKEFLSTWLKNHVKGTDRLYMECMSSKGIS